MDDIEASDFFEGADTLEEIVSKKSDAMEIHKLLHDLSEPYKEVFMMRIFGELSFKQIGLIFCKTENWACVTHHRARNKILEIMEDSHNEKQM